METGAPDWPSMGVFESVSNRTVDEVPQLDTIITARRNQVRPDRMEIHPAQPVLMPLPRHNIFLRLHVPDLPRTII